MIVETELVFVHIIKCVNRFTLSYEKVETVMNKNLIFDGNTIYEIDPVCMKEKRMWEKRRGWKFSETLRAGMRSQNVPCYPMPAERFLVEIYVLAIILNHRQMGRSF